LAPLCNCCGDQHLIWQRSGNDSYGATVEAAKGHSEFIGTTLESSTDREQRDDAQSICKAISRAAADAEKLPRCDIAQIWNDVRDSWSSEEAEGVSNFEAEPGRRSAASLLTKDEGKAHCSQSRQAAGCLGSSHRQV
jgi:hypothetical protein